MKKYQRIRSILIPLIGFFLILLMMNGYQYIKVKRDFAAGLVREISDVEVGELRLFFDDIQEKLLLIRDWGQNDVLLTGDITGLNNKFIPFLQRLPYISGVVLASNTGQHYSISKDGDNFLSRYAHSSGEKSIKHYAEISPDLTELKTWEKEDPYDPRTRPWFVESSGDTDVHWTGLYTFFHSDEPGITASVSWNAPKDKTKFLVLGIDISVAKIKEILAIRESERPGMLFLTKSDGTLISATTDAGDSEILSELTEQWKEAGKPDQELLRTGKGNDRWLGSFQRISAENGIFWVGFAAPESELLGWLDQTLFAVDPIEIGIALSGAVLILLLTWRFRVLGRRQDLPESPDIRLLKAINKGEGAEIEFKSTVRTNLKSGKVGKEIELAWLKGVVAFLNSSGGTVLLGIDDSAQVCGIAIDGFDSDDRCLLHIKNLLNQHIGAEFSSFFEVSLVDCQQQQVVMVECRPAAEPVFLKIGKNEEFYIRSGPSSIKLTPSQMVSYVQQNKK